MDEYESLSHTAWECKYHVVFCRRHVRMSYLCRVEMSG